MDLSFHELEVELDDGVVERGVFEEDSFAFGWIDIRPQQRPSRRAKSALKNQRSETVAGSKSSEKRSSPGVHITTSGGEGVSAVAVAEIEVTHRTRKDVAVAFMMIR